MEDLYFRIVLYLKQNGETDMTKFELYNGQVSKWDYELRKPTTDELNAVSQEDIENERTCYIACLNPVVLCKLSVTQANMMLPKNALYIDSDTGLLSYVL